MKEKFFKEIALEIKRIMLDHNDTPQDLSIKSGINTDLIMDYEQGKKDMDIYIIEQILNPYNIDLYIFFQNIFAKKQK